MYSPSRKIRASVRRTIWLIVLGCLSGLLLIETILQFESNTDNSLILTRSAGAMLNRTQMILAKQVLLEPPYLTCNTTNNYRRNSVLRYPLYIVVKTRAVSSGDYFQRRMFTRTTWAREARALGIPVLYAVGRASDEQTQRTLEYEHQIYGDLLQFNYTDDYYNLTIKTTGVLHWFISRGCHRATPYLYYVDDDVLINVQSLIRTISETPPDSNTIFGNYIRSIRPHPIGKWAVSIEDYPNATYPPFITGASTLYPSALINRLVDAIFRQADNNIPILFLDDIFVTGLIAGPLGIGRARMYGIENCSHTDLLSHILINECNNFRRPYVWSKFILSRAGQDTSQIDAILGRMPFRGHTDVFNRSRNGSILFPSTSQTTTPMTSQERIALILCHHRSSIIVILLFIIIIRLVFIPLPKLFSYWQQPIEPTTIPSTLINSSSSAIMLLTPVK